MGGSSKDTNDAPAKDSIGLFRLQDLEAMEVDQPELFPASPPPARRTPTDPFQTESVVAAIRRARRQDSGDFESTGLDTSPGRDEPDLADVDSDVESGDDDEGDLADALLEDAPPLDSEPIDLVEELPDTPRSLPLSSARTPNREEITPVPVELAVTGADSEGGAPVAEPQPVSRSDEKPRYGTGEAKAVIAAAARDYRQRSHLSTLLTVGIPLLLLGVTVLVVLLVLRASPPMLDVRFPVVTPETVVHESNLVEMAVALIPTSPPEIDEGTPGEDEGRPRHRDRGDDDDRRRHSHRRDRDRDRDNEQLQDLDLGF